MEVRIETLDDIEIARVRHVGPYGEVGPCFERLFEWVATIGARPGRVLGIYHDDPSVVAPERLRADACVEVRTDASPPPGVVMDTIAAGRYAVYTHRGPYDGLPEAYKLLYGMWLPQSGEEVGDRPCLEMYHNSPVDTALAQLVTDVCLPLRATPNG